MLLFNRSSFLDIIILIPAILLALTVHECAHAWMAWKRGDATAMGMGRVTLNPFVHLDILGSIVLVLTGFIGWAKPVPVDPRNFDNPKRDMALVAAAGPLANLVTAAFFLGLLLFLDYNFAIVNKVLPIPIQTPLMSFMVRCLIINLAFAFINLVPLPPLDGFNVISAFLPLNVVMFCLRYRMFFMFALILFFWQGPFFSIFNRLIGLVFNFFF
ncbi:MAG: site-2 protease family protein [Deltaproteobacteria bacterium]|jgi:Zn-dependent protease|nr:site-2 protease family protein [Deltaproteobacteria bacterium]